MASSFVFCLAVKCVQIISFSLEIRFFNNYFQISVDNRGYRVDCFVRYLFSLFIDFDRLMNFELEEKCGEPTLHRVHGGKAIEF